MKSITFENFIIQAGTDASLVPTDNGLQRPRNRGGYPPSALSSPTPPPGAAGHSGRGGHPPSTYDRPGQANPRRSAGSPDPSRRRSARRHTAPWFVACVPCVAPGTSPPAARSGSHAEAPAPRRVLLCCNRRSAPRLLPITDGGHGTGSAGSGSLTCPSGGRAHSSPASSPSSSTPRGPRLPFQGRIRAGLRWPGGETAWHRRIPRSPGLSEVRTGRTAAAPPLLMPRTLRRTF
ncbi:hypothetical protein ZWY2020_006696 [Hordeum vulgare]|nr:hypothetical protein ZWY2020_006696 [Hordeum vulgare]